MPIVTLKNPPPHFANGISSLPSLYTHTFKKKMMRMYFLLDLLGCLRANPNCAPFTMNTAVCVPCGRRCGVAPRRYPSVPAVLVLRAGSELQLPLPVHSKEHVFVVASPWGTNTLTLGLPSSHCMQFRECGNSVENAGVWNVLFWLG